MKTVLLAIIRVYQLSFSMLLGRNCRYLPTCSDYAREAIDKHGVWRGFLLGLARVSRCRPGGGDGFDPVPEVYERPAWLQKKRGS